MNKSKKVENNIRKLTKVAQHSMGLTLPIDLVRSLSWKEKQKVVVKKHNGALVVRDWKKR